MEDYKAYIESGVLELYVLGDLPEAERMYVEEMMANHAEVRDEVHAIEKVLELTAENYAVEPADHVKDNVFARLFSEQTGHTPEGEITSFEDERKLTDEKIVYLPSQQNKFYKYSLAASVALLAASVITIVYLNNELKTSRSSLLALQQQNQQFANQVIYLDKELKSSASMLDIYQDPGFKVVKLAGTKLSPGSEMIVAWNPREKKVAIDRRALKLPENDAQYQYQLWALVDGKPVDLGVFDSEKDSTGVLDMKSIAIAQAFAVTREPRGGSKSPTLDQMVVMGAITQ